MRPVICAWCGTLQSGRLDASLEITHGICPACLTRLEYREEPLEAFLESLPPGTALVDHDVRVLDASSTFLDFVGKDRSDVVGRLGGQVISCVYSQIGDGCGRTAHCVGCAIRRAVNAAHESGEPQFNPHAFAHVHADGRTVTVWLQLEATPTAGGVLFRVAPGEPPADRPECSTS